MNEGLITNFGLDYAILRNNWYLENEGLLIDSIKKEQPFASNSGTGRAG
ncbi:MULTISPECIES: hypothetical protein [unclassified Enterococcus]|nr:MULTISPECIES: hypothetical protein [unclassified Enterococcus]MBS7576364.1 hypothetical protein [Enterococcus sp. MMGLQ5-2]MBS7583596.1 hypothetical protein [Enterococcus sp. MMGLQ5-1]NPD11458.1 hypothetical protein [Enterococcus sp. MMGLQ5-1]NPD36202.1 hypothetical protein [Enterococcus sp. MMGLQ5-2]